MRRIVLLASARSDLVDILAYITQRSGSLPVGRRFVKEIRGQIVKLASLPGSLGRARPDLKPDIRSVAFKGYVIFFRYRREVFEVVNILEGHRDIASFYGEDELPPTP